MSKKTLLPILIVILLVPGYFLASYLWPVNLGEQRVTLIVEPGDGFKKVGDQLLAQEVVSSKAMLFVPARWRGIDKKLVPGRYDFTGSNSCKSVLDKLENGDFVVVRLTVYEGAPIWKVASILSERLEIDSAEVVAFNTNTAFLETLELPSLEGYLFPETYFIPWGTGTRQILSDMVAMYRSQTGDIWPEEIINGLSREEIIIMASIVEAEALLDDEKPRVASVYQNRIRRRMKLDADPTVIYGLGGLDRPLNRRDLRQVTPYNTYRKKGLPPTPINSPGLNSIKAALYPDSTDYLYFVADGSGGHRFSRTNAEHNRARYEIKNGIGQSGM
ncbi:MAG: endolytic transglycosylase MltG [bacterium]|nr:endolytic transglycosylase MltG [bacterium]